MWVAALGISRQLSLREKDGERERERERDRAHSTDNRNVKLSCRARRALMLTFTATLLLDSEIQLSLRKCSCRKLSKTNKIKSLSLVINKDWMTQQFKRPDLLRFIYLGNNIIILLLCYFINITFVLFFYIFYSFFILSTIFHKLQVIIIFAAELCGVKKFQICLIALLHARL